MLAGRGHPPGVDAVVEHRLERCGGRAEAARHRAEAGAEEVSHVGGHVRNPDIRLRAAPVFGTDLHTLGKLGQEGGVEGGGGERVVHVVF